jgi:hypothetical protein
MPRFFFHLTSVNRNITDDTGKELHTWNDTYNHARKLIGRYCYAGSDEVNSWRLSLAINMTLRSSFHSRICSLPTPAERQAIQHDAGGQ